MESAELLKKYLQDLNHIGNRIFELHSNYYRAGTIQKKEPYKTTPFDLAQLEFNVPMEPHENIVELLNSIGETIMISEGIEYVKVKEEIENMEIPTIEIDKLRTIEAIDLCYNLELQDAVKESKIPVDLVTISYQIKNQLKFPDDFFNEFPSKLMETPQFNSPSSANKYGIIQDMKAYYSFYHISKDFVVPVLSYPASLHLDQNIKTEGLLMSLSERFNSFTKESDFEVYTNFRMIKNIRNKLLLKKGNPASISLFTEKELLWCRNSGFFEERDEKLRFSEGLSMADLNEEMNNHSIKIDELIRNWKRSKLF